MKCTATPLLFLLAVTAGEIPHSANELRFCLRAEPKTFDPLMVQDEPSEAVRFLTGGVLIRLNRRTQELEPELAASWSVSENGRRIDFKLRQPLRFSDGSPLTAADVAYTIQRVMDPNLHSPLADQFRSGSGAVETRVTSPKEISVRFPAPISALALQFDELAIESHETQRQAQGFRPMAGAFAIAEYKAGNYILLRRNPYYWKHHTDGRPLPQLDSIRLDIQQSRDLEALRFRRGEIDLIEKLDPELYERIAAEAPKSVVDAGPALDAVVMWFNQNPAAPIAANRKAWFASAAFRRAVSYAIHREDICRIVYRGHAQPAASTVSPSNYAWSDSSLKADTFSTGKALELLKSDGFHQDRGVLYDRSGNAVQFSIATNSGNKLHERMLTLIQDDLGHLGISVRIATIDFPSLIERITRTFDYDACLLPLSPGLDPSSQMNIWLSSGANHQWNPQQAKPATAWEAELDRFMLIQATAMDQKKRKEAFNRVQQIAHEQVPFIYLVHPNSLCAVSSRLRNASPSLLRPHVFWNAEHLAIAP
jgi:peptide/nickel transport system substrate-binding protein